MSALAVRCRIPLAAAFAAILAFAVFARALFYDFVYDDRWTILENHALERPLAGVLRECFAGRGFASNIPDSTRPVMVVSMWIDTHLFGRSSAVGFHAHSLLLYALSAALAACVAFALSRRFRVAVLASAFFAVAPVHAEVACAINYREDLYAAIAELGIVAWLFWPRRRAETIDSAVFVAALFALGLLGKESTVSVFPIAIAAFLARPRLDIAWRNRKTFVVLGLVLGIWGAWRLSLRLRGVDDVPVAAPRSLLGLLSATARYEVRAVVGALLPGLYSPEYNPQRAVSPAWVAVLVVLVVVVALLVRRRATRLAGSGIAIALLAPLVTSPLVGPVNERADRYLFVGVLGGALLWADAADRLLSPLGRGRRAWFWTAAALSLVALAFGAQRAARPWRNDMALWTEGVARAPKSSRAWNGLSRELRRAGDLDGADRAIERAVALDPKSVRVRITRVYDRLARGDVERAKKEIAEIDQLIARQKAKTPDLALMRGLAKARRCALLPSPEAIGCINSEPLPQ